MKALIFDVDGTLWDSTDSVARGWKRAFLQMAELCEKEKMSKNFASELEKSLRDAAAGLSGARLKLEFGKPMQAIFESLLPDITQLLHAESGAALSLRENFFRTLEEKCYAMQDAELAAHSGRLYPGVRETLPLLAESLPLYIVSNCQKGYIERFLSCTGLGTCFRAWLCYGDTGCEKDVTLRKLLLQEQIEPKRAVYVGDTEGDAAACRKAGLPFIWAAYGFGSVKKESYLARIACFSDLSILSFHSIADKI